MAKKNKASGITGASSLQAQASVNQVSRGDSAQVVNAQEIIARISQQSVLVSVKIHLWRGTKSAPHLKNALIKETKGDEEGFNSPILVIIPPAMRTPLTAKATEALNFFKKHSVPYGEARLRLVPTRILPDVQKILGELDVELRNLGDNVALNRKDIIAWAKQKLGSAFAEDDIPSTEELKNKCHIQIDYSAISVPPTLEGEGSESLRKNIEDSMVRQYNEGLKTVIADVVEQLKVTAEALKKEDQKNIRYGSLIGNFMKSLKRLRKLNIGEAPEVEELITKSLKAMQKLADADVDGSLKKGDEAKKKREEVEKDVDDVSKTLDSFTL
jgi:hypothetical protein